MTSTISIKTRLNSGIYASQGGGQVKTHYTYTTGPRNLLKAIDQYWQHRKEMERSFGNIGCGASWIEVDGKQLHDLADLADFTYVDAEGTTRTQLARELLASVKSR